MIFQNLTIHHVHEGEGDALEVTSDSSNVWIDHNEFYSELYDEPDKDYYDGLVDIKRNSQYVTVSWNYFHDHWKASLVGHTDSAGDAPDKVTYDHNLFADINTRVPLIRYADVHMLNNVIRSVNGSAVNARMGPGCWSRATPSRTWARARSMTTPDTSKARSAGSTAVTKRVTGTSRTTPS
ncbi:polysaccharide lyase family 1 protein [Streptomyces sp. M10(2022)]